MNKPKYYINPHNFHYKLHKVEDGKLYYLGLFSQTWIIDYKLEVEDLIPLNEIDLILYDLI